jgi:hypothetical protein
MNAPDERTLPPYWKGGIAGSSLLLFLIACALPAARLENGTVWPGGQMLLSGALGALFGQFAWYANLLYFLTLIFVALGRRRVALVLSFGPILLALDMLAFPGTEILLDEGGVNKTRVLALLPGAWVWLAALTLPVFGLLAAPRNRI